MNPGGSATVVCSVVALTAPRKLAFNMEALRGAGPATVKDSLTTQKPVASTGGQTEMMMPGETETGGQIRLFASEAGAESLEKTPGKPHNPAMPLTPKDWWKTPGAPIIPKGTYVPSNWSKEEFDRHWTRNSRNTRRSVEDTIKDLGSAPAGPPASPKSTGRTKS